MSDKDQYKVSASTTQAIVAKAENDIYKDDPFFRWIPDPQWNACIGTQGSEVHYLDGYIESAIELNETILRNGKFAQRDTLIIPILYNARHGLELALKYVDDRLTAAGLITEPKPQKPDHDLSAYWGRLDRAKVPDRELRGIVTELKRFVDSLSGIDPDGTKLRYFHDLDGQSSINDRSLVNLRWTYKGLHELKAVVDRLKFRTQDFLAERSSGGCTKEFSRADLAAIAEKLPRHATWGEEGFRAAKAEICHELNISNKALSRAIEAIRERRETKAVIGIETDLLYLSDDDVVWFVEQWIGLHPERELDDDDLGTDYFGDAEKRFAEMIEYREKKQASLGAVTARMSEKQIAELEAIYQHGREGWHSEYYERDVEKGIGLTQPGSIERQILYLLEKTNLLVAFERAAPRIGRIELTHRLSNVRGCR